MENRNNLLDGLSKSVIDSAISLTDEQIDEINHEEQTGVDQQNESCKDYLTPIKPAEQHTKEKQKRSRLNNKDREKAKNSIEKLYKEENPLLFIQISTKLSPTKFMTLLTELFLENRIKAVIPKYNLVESNASIKSLFNCESDWKYVIVEKFEDHIKLTKYEFDETIRNDNVNSDTELGKAGSE